MKDIKTKFHNISKILDCVSCEKCRLNGKVQIKGLGTAMKVLFSQPKSLIPNQRDEMKLLTRTEIVVIFI
jgi:hypothetical protein